MFLYNSYFICLFLRLFFDKECNDFIVSIGIDIFRNGNLKE